MAPKKGKLESDWKKERAALLAKAKKLGIKIQLTENAPRSLKTLGIQPRVAPDGRVDINSVVEIRREKDY